MSLVKDTISNFIGGVSQQPDKIMYPNQAKSLINYLPNPSDGLLKRPPTEHIARLMDKQEKHPFTHTIIKEDEAYKVILTGNDIKVFDLQGNEKVVNFTDEKDRSYITASNPLKELYATTIADYTFILNKTKIAEMNATTFTPKYPKSALVFLRQANYNSVYEIRINNILAASYTTAGSVSNQVAATTGEQSSLTIVTNNQEVIRTTTIAYGLFTQLVSNLGTTNWDFQLNNSCILITNRSNADFTISTRDSNADIDLMSFYKETNSFEKLPVIAPDGFCVKITGDEYNKADDYYIQFKTSDSSSFGTGSWQECCKPAIKYQIDPTTMPHSLIREANGTFTFKTVEWSERQAGDEDTAPTPSFIGNTIQDIFTHKGRLAFVSIDKSIYSDTQDIFSFFKRTTLTELETDPIDVGSNSKMVLLKHSLPFNELLLLFSETSVFSLKGGDVFSNNTVACDLTMEYPCSKECRPINAGETGFFLFENGEYSRVMELYLTSTYSMGARDITEQVPSYLPNKMYKIAGSTANNIACFLSTKEPENIYIYNYYYSSEQKVQSAWHRWNFENTKILNADFKENWLYLTTQYDDGIYLERMNFSPKNKEIDLDYLFYLDRKFYVEGNALKTGEETTTFTKPYKNSKEFLVLNTKGFPLNIVTEDATTITVEGIQSKVIVGIPFCSSWVLPHFYVRQQTSSGSTKVKEGILMLKDLVLSYAQTGSFKIFVNPRYDTNISSMFEFTGKICGMDSSRLEQTSVSDGTFPLPLISHNESIEIEVINDSYLPSCFLSIEWLGEFVIRG